MKSRASPAEGNIQEATMKAEIRALISGAQHSGEFVRKILAHYLMS